MFIISFILLYYYLLLLSCLHILLLLMLFIIIMIQPATREYSARPSGEHARKEGRRRRSRGEHTSATYFRAPLLATMQIRDNYERRT